MTDGPPTLADVSFVGDLAAVRKMLAAGADVNAGVNGWTPLVAALRERPKFFDDNAYAIVELLLSHGADLSACDVETGRAPLHEAVATGSRAVSLLLTHGADPNAESHSGSTPLHECIDVGAVDVARALVKAGADPKRLDSNGHTAVDLARLEAQAHPEDEDAVALVKLLDDAEASAP